MGTFFDYLIARGYSINTINAYLLCEKIFVRDYCPELRMGQDDINKFIISHNNSVGRAFMKGYLDFLSLGNEYNVPAFKGRKKTKETKHLTKEIVYFLADKCDLKLGLVILIMFEGGLRISECLRLRWKDINLVSRRIKVSELGKTGFREVIFSSFTSDVLEKYSLYSEEEYLFKDLKVRGVQKNLESLGNEYLGYKITPHMMRHTTGFYLDSLGWGITKIQKYLGHKDITSTVKYTHTEKEKVLEEAEVAFN